VQGLSAGSEAKVSKLDTKMEESSLSDSIDHRGRGPERRWGGLVGIYDVEDSEGEVAVSASGLQHGCQRKESLQH